MRQFFTFKTIAIFILSFVVFFVCFHGIRYYLQAEQKVARSHHAHINLENIKDRFNLFMKIPLTVGRLGVEYFSEGGIHRPYGPFNETFLQSHQEIIGLNILDPDGKIIRVFPEELNKKAIGRVSQNYAHFKSSLERGEEFWISEPFRLYQGMNGFVVYYPITTGGKLLGWFAPVINCESFGQYFNLEKFQSIYNLSIRDNTSGKEFFATGVAPEKKKEIFSITDNFAGREISFVIWRLDSIKAISIPMSWNVVISFILASLIVTLYKFYEQRRRVNHQLQDVSTLLKLTSKEALSKLVDLQKEFYKLGSPETIDYVTHLIEQIDLLQTTANTKKEIECENLEVLPCILKEIDELKDLSGKKGLEIDVAREKFVNFYFYTNPWMFNNIIINNILSHLIVHAESGSAITIDSASDKKMNSLIFHAQRVYSVKTELRAINLDRRMAVTKAVMNLFNGSVEIVEDMGGGIITRIDFPKSLP